MYIKPERVLESFRRLRIRPDLNEGEAVKRGRERTSALSVFFAYDMTGRDGSPLSLDPETLAGKHNRAKFTAAFSRVTLLRNLTGRRALATYDFGDVEFCPTLKRMPDSKLTNNFLTTRLIKAADQGKPLEYPLRPPSPMLLLGPDPASSLNDRWAVRPHPAWRDNLPTLLADRLSTTTFLDLAVFLLRDVELQGDSDGVGIVEAGLRSIFSLDLACLWVGKVRAETRLHDGGWLTRDVTWLQAGHAPTFEERDYLPPVNTEQRLRAYIKTLQSALDDFGYDYDPTPE